MYFQFLIEDKSTEILVNHVMEKLKIHHNEKDIAWDTKAFGGIGNLPQKGKPLERKTGKLLNDLPGYMRAFDKILQVMGNAVLVIVLDNDKRDCEQFRKELENMAVSNMVLCDYVFCIAIKEMEAWLLGDLQAITAAYPEAKTQYIKKYKQDGICDTWEILAEMVYPQGIRRLRREACGSYVRIGTAKCEWADKIGKYLHLHGNASPSYNYFVEELEKRVLESNM